MEDLLPKPNASYRDCAQFINEEPISWRDVKDSREYLPLFSSKAQIAVDAVITKRDTYVADLIAKTSWVPNVPVHGQWDASTGNPVRDLLLMKQSIRPARATDILLGQDVWAALITNANSLAFMNVSANHALADENWFAKVVAKKLGFRKLVVVDSMYNSSQIPTSQTPAEIFAGKVFVGQIEPRQDVLPSDMASTALARVVEAPLTIHEYDDHKNRSRVAHAHMSEITVVANNKLGVIMHNVISHDYC